MDIIYVNMVRFGLKTFGLCYIDIRIKRYPIGKMLILQIGCTQNPYTLEISRSLFKKLSTAYYILSYILIPHLQILLYTL